MSHPARPHARLTGCCALLALLAAAPAAFADPYTPDPGYNNGQMEADNFAGGYDYRRGQKLVRLDNGDIIVAGVVPGVGDAAGHTKIGLVRYDSAGMRQTWSNSGANGFHNGQYVITPCISSVSLCGDVTDVKSAYRYGDRIFVLANDDHVTFRTSPPFGAYMAPGVNVYVFGTDGSLQSLTTIDGADGATGSGIAVYGSGTFPETVSLVYVGNTVVDNVWSPRFARYTVAGDSSLTAQTEAMEPALGECGSSQCQFNGIALGGDLTGAARVYVAGSKYHVRPPDPVISPSTGWYAFAARLNANGTPATSFNDTGINVLYGAFDKQSGGQKIAVKRAGIVGEDEVFLMSDVEQSCKNGIGVTKFKQNGNADTSFNGNGTIQYGGSDQNNTQSCTSGWAIGSIRADYPKDIAYANGKLGVAGFNVYRTPPLCVAGQPCHEDDVDGELAVIDSASGAIESWRGYAYSETPAGARSRHSGFWGIIAGGDDTFSVTGDVRYFDSAPADRAGRNMYVTLRLAPQGDVIFKNGFD